MHLQRYTWLHWQWLTVACWSSSLQMIHCQNWYHPFIPNLLSAIFTHMLASLSSSSSLQQAFGSLFVSPLTASSWLVFPLRRKRSAQRPELILVSVARCFTVSLLTSLIFWTSALLMHLVSHAYLSPTMACIKHLIMNFGYIVYSSCWRLGQQSHFSMVELSMLCTRGRKRFQTRCPNLMTVSLKTDRWLWCFWLWPSRSCYSLRGNASLSVSGCSELALITKWIGACGSTLTNLSLLQSLELWSILPSTSYFTVVQGLFSVKSWFPCLQRSAAETTWRGRLRVLEQSSLTSQWHWVSQNLKTRLIKTF